MAPLYPPEKAHNWGRRRFVVAHARGLRQHADSSTSRRLPFSLLRGRWGGAAHVHVQKGGAAAKVWLHPVRVEYAHDFNPAELRRLRELAVEHAGFFTERWNEYFGR